MFPYAIVLLVSVFLASISQVMLKKAAQKKYRHVWQEYLNPLVILSYSIFFLTTLLGVLAYRGLPLSLGPVLETTSYFYIAIFGVVLFKEQPSVKKWLALGLIVVGVLVYAFG